MQFTLYRQLQRLYFLYFYIPFSARLNIIIKNGFYSDSNVRLCGTEFGSELFWYQNVWVLCCGIYNIDMLCLFGIFSLYLL